MMDQGSYGFSIPTFPSHTPTNFATLLTGSYPITHGVADGPMRIEGQPLHKPSIAGFSSVARKVPAIWNMFDDSKKIVLLSLPGTTPPEKKPNMITIKGRWGGWGAEFHSVIFEKLSVQQRIKQARNSRLFFLGMELTQYIDPEITNENFLFSNEIKELYIPLTLYGTTIHANLIKEKNNFKSISFARTKDNIDTTLSKGEWSEWFPINLTWNNQTVKTNVKYHVINVGPDDYFRVRILVDSLNSFIAHPLQVSNDLKADIGPMIDYVDNFPPQLIYYPEDKKTFISESKMSFAWHMNAMESINKRHNPDIFIHDIYSPNQMLTSKWWMGYIDPDSKIYYEIDSKKRSKLINEVEEMYRDVDAIIGKVLDDADEDTLVVFSSDHGALPLNTSVLINNLFAKKGWLKYSLNENTGEHIIDWNNSKVVFLKMSNVYINTNGLGPIWNREVGPDYENLRNEVIQALEELKDDEGKNPLLKAVKWENVASELKIPADRSGDIVIVVRPGYGWAEDITKELNIFNKPLATGYKQSLLAEHSPGLWTPFIITGKGIKKNHRIMQPLQHADQTPTILRAMGKNIPEYMEGSIIEEIFK
jgi:predicted AlkP superfamily phosphohydrolase/phosphomutase